MDLNDGVGIDDGPMFEHHHEKLNGLDYHYVTCGSGPAVLFCHGFPDLWRGWRHQMRAVADAGYMAIAPDLRGFGGSDGPTDPSAYTVVDVVGDLVALLDHLEIPTSTIVGHDWGANISWAAPILRPDRFTAVMSLSVPYAPRPPLSLPAALRASGQSRAYMLYFLEPGVADAELDANPREFLRNLFYANSGSLPAGETPNITVSDRGTIIDALQSPPGELPWFDDAELEIYVEAFKQRGFTSALDTYRSLDRGWQLMAAFADRKLNTPASYIYGDRDIVISFPGRREVISQFTTLAPKGRPPVCLPGVGHFLQIEQPQAVSDALVDFLRSLPQVP
jgi:pimeloyl-ACP methyl ester carboxylesterase